MMTDTASLPTSVAPRGTIPHKMALHLSLRRFVIYLSVSAVAVSLPSLVLQMTGNAFLIPCIAFQCGAIFSVASQFIPGMLPTSYPYSICTSLLLASLHPLTTLIEPHGAPDQDFSPTQHAAVNLGLAFFVLSECEFYRAYVTFRPGALFLFANVDREFPMARETYVYLSLDEYASWWQRYVTDAPTPTTFLRILFSARYNVFYILFVVFHVVSGYWHWQIMGVIDPREEGFWLAVMRQNGVFVPKEAAMAMLGTMVLGRVVRVGNACVVRALGWYGVRVCDWWRMRKEETRVTVDEEKVVLGGSAGAC
jgi:hypothetical protein